MLNESGIYDLLLAKMKKGTPTRVDVPYEETNSGY